MQVIKGMNELLLPENYVAMCYFTGMVIAFCVVSFILYDIFKGFCFVLIDVIRDIVRLAYKHTKHYKKKHEKLLSLFVPCVHIVRQLYEEKLIDKDQGLMLLNSLEEYKDNHTKD